jgi:hypothetical protein
MKGITVTYNPQIKLTLTADDWQLYGGEDYPLRDMVARNLNANIQQVLNDPDCNDREKKQVCWNYLRMYDNYGASDTEGMAMLDTIFYEFFGPTYEEA